MREGIGEAFTINIIVIFIVIVFGILAGAVNYYKAFKVNSYILAAVDKFEGYNSPAKTEIETGLNAFGYFHSQGTYSCPDSRGQGKEKAKLVSDKNPEYFYCVYYYADDTPKTSRQTNAKNKPLYYNYSVVSYISVDLPIAGVFNIPVHTKGERIFRFSTDANQAGGGN